MSVLEAIILGIIQGLTEFLPVSSSGHVELARVLLGVEVEQNLTFTLLVHVATVLSTIVALWREIVNLLQGFFRFRWNAQMRYIVLLLVSLVPVALVGFLLEDRVEALFTGNLLLVGCMLLVTSLLLFLTYRARNSRGTPPTLLSSIVMGVGQAVAVLPGLSRSGTTISLGLLCGVSRAEAAHFSFLMVIPPILGKALLDLLAPQPMQGAGIPTMALVAGFLSAFVMGYIACRWMIAIVKRAKLSYFALYCLLVGLVAIIFHFI